MNQTLHNIEQRLLNEHLEREAEAIDEQQVNRVFDRLEHQSFFMSMLAKGDPCWLGDFENACRDDEATAQLHRQALRLAADLKVERAGFTMEAAIRRAADWYYEENGGNPF